MVKFIRNFVLTIVIAFTIIAFYGIISPNLYSQEKSGVVSGTVMDKLTNAPVEGADVTIHKTTDSSLVKGTSTDASGKFIISGIPEGKYYIKANLVGYSFAVISGINITPENLALTLDPIKLSSGSTTTEEIVVEGEKSLFEFKADKKVFNVSKSLSSQGGTLIDLLKEIPSVTVDQDGNVSLRGGEGVKILIDGRPFGLEGANRNVILQQIAANTVESVELITNPSAKFEAEGSTGIINVVLKKDKTRNMGYLGTLGLNIGTGDKYGGQFGLSLKGDKFNLYGNYNYNARNNTSTGFSDRIYFNDSDIEEILQNSSGRGIDKGHTVKLGLDYYLNPNNTLGFSVNYRNSNRRSSRTSSVQQYDTNGSLASNYFSTSNGTDKGYSIDANANYTMKFKERDRELNLNLSYSKDNDEDFDYNADNYLFPLVYTSGQRNEFSNGLNNSFTGKLDYAHPFSKDIKLETGYRGSYKKRDNDYRVENFVDSAGQFITDPNQSNRFVYKEIVNAGYVIYTQQVGTFGFSLGGRVEHTKINGELVTTNRLFDRSYIDFFPSASISQKITDNTEIQLSYSRRINRPRPRQLNPFRTVSMGGTNNYSEGNPDLKPEFTNAYELSFIQFFPWATITPSVFYRRTTDEISRQRTLLDSISTLSTFVNLNSSRSYGGELIISSHPAKFVNLNGTFSVYRTEVDANNLQTGLQNGTTTWSARGNTTFTLPENISLQLSYFYSGKRVTSNGTIDPLQSFDVALKKTLFDNKLSLTLRASDVFNTNKFRVNFNDINFSEITEGVRDSRGLFLNVSYTFGKEDKKQNEKKRRENNNNDNEGEKDFGF